uniref:Myelin expression factor 2 n=1 Tax=Petromyzon marinus TaxID=7757 RepID=S4R8H7_PETMA
MGGGPGGMGGGPGGMGGGPGGMGGGPGGMGGGPGGMGGIGGPGGMGGMGGMGGNIPISMRNNPNIPPELLNALQSGRLGTTVFVTNLDYKVGWKKIKEVFGMAGVVKRAEIKEDKEGRSRGMGVIIYEQPVEALQAISMFNGQLLFERQMHVKMDDRSLPKDDFLPADKQAQLPHGLGGIGMGLGPGGQPIDATRIGSMGSAGPAGGLDSSPGYGAMDRMGGLGGGSGSGGGGYGGGLGGMGNAGGLANRILLSVDYNPLSPAGMGGMDAYRGGMGSNMPSSLPTGTGLGMGVHFFPDSYKSNMVFDRDLGMNRGYGSSGGMGEDGTGVTATHALKRILPANVDVTSCPLSGGMGAVGMGGAGMGVGSMGSGSSGIGHMGGNMVPMGAGMGGLGMGGMGLGGIGSSMDRLGSMGNVGGGGGGGPGMGHHGHGLGAVLDMDRGSGAGGGAGIYGLPRDRDGYGGGAGNMGASGLGGMPLDRMDRRGCQIFVRNLAFDLSWQKLKETFSQCGQVMFADIKKENGRSKGCGTVRFDSPEAAEKACHMLNGIRINGREIDVRIDKNV